MIAHAMKARFCSFGSTLSKIGLISAGEPGRADRVQQHPDDGHDEAQAVGPGVAEQPLERVHSLNRYLRSTQSATNPSRQVIFLPSL